MRHTDSRDRFYEAPKHTFLIRLIGTTLSCHTVYDQFLVTSIRGVTTKLSELEHELPFTAEGFQGSLIGVDTAVKSGDKIGHRQ